MKETPFGTGDGLGRIVAAGRNSWQGVKDAWRLEAAFRQEALLLCVLLPVALLVPASAVEHVLLAASLLLVLIVELLNSAIEAAVDRISLAHHELSGRAKDLGSAAVLFSLLLVLLTWGTILLPRFL
ncbi:MAG: diacylglycerol kinase [Betaproteobacteria bacterium]|nr:diacylglycerol kinase [Betaproteobacteria bacterium]